MPAAPGSRTRLFALGGVVGPVAFAGTWVVAGIVKSGYSPLHDPISDLAGIGASTRPAMTTAFVVFAGGMCSYAWAMRSTRLGLVSGAAAVSGLATIGVAAFPLHHSATVDSVHGVFAGTGYVTLTATALGSAVVLTRLGYGSWASVAAVTGAVSAASLALTLIGSFGGLFQRLGLTAGDVWVVTSAAAIYRGAAEPFRVRDAPGPLSPRRAP
jgi:hypothetical membrane protein